MSTIIITGASSGLGAAMVRALGADGHAVYNYDVAANPAHDVRDGAAAARFLARVGECDILINNAGINGLDWLADLDEDKWDSILDTNAKGIYVMTRAALPYLLDSCGTILNIVSDAAHRPMRASLAYNASKGAAHIMTLQLARELSPVITVLGVAPNRLAATGMTETIDAECKRVRGWTRERAAAYERAASLVPERTPPVVVADFIAYLLRSKDNHKYLSGCILPYGA